MPCVWRGGPQLLAHRGRLHRDVRRVRLSDAPVVLRAHRGSRQREALVLPGVRGRRAAGRGAARRRRDVRFVPCSRGHPDARAAAQPVGHGMGLGRHARAPVLRRQFARGDRHAQHDVRARRGHAPGEELAHGAGVRIVRPLGRVRAVLDEELLPGLPRAVLARGAPRGAVPGPGGQSRPRGFLLRRAQCAGVFAAPADGRRARRRDGLGGGGGRRPRRRAGGGSRPASPRRAAARRSAARTTTRALATTTRAWRRTRR